MSALRSPDTSLIVCKLASLRDHSFVCGVVASRSLLSSVLEGTDELGNVIVVVLSLVLGASQLSKLGLEILVLLGTDLLEDVWHHAGKFFGLGVSGDDQKVLPHGELGCKKRGETDGEGHLLWGLFKLITVLSSKNMFTSSISCRVCMPRDSGIGMRTCWERLTELLNGGLDLLVFSDLLVVPNLLSSPLGS